MNWNKKIIWDITVKELTLVIIFYVFSVLLYSLTLAINSLDWSESDFKTEFGYYMIRNGIDYSLKLILTIPIWYLIFKVFKEWKLWQRLLLHIPLLLGFIYVGKYLFYSVCEYFDLGHLQGSGQVWDLYMPTLFYFIQFGIYHTYEFFQRSKQSQIDKMELEKSVIKSELSALKSQLNPHFLYNVFNTISASVPREQERTREMIAILSDMFRYQLRASEEDFVLLRDELEFVKNYLSLEKERFEGRLDVIIDVDDKLLSEKLPPMILQPLVENAIKHGISSKIEGGFVKISAMKLNGKIHFEIADSGIGINDKSGIFEKGIGLRNTKLRLQKMFGSELIISDNTPSGLKVEFDI